MIFFLKKPEKEICLTDEQKLQFGIELVAAMKANAYDTDMETGRIMALEDTDIDKLALFTPEEFEKLDNEFKNKMKDVVMINKEELHHQALFMANAALKYLNGNNCK